VQVSLVPDQEKTEDDKTDRTSSYGISLPVVGLIVLFCAITEHADNPGKGVWMPSICVAEVGDV
jgi:hypothetical protein